MRCADLSDQDVRGLLSLAGIDPANGMAVSRLRFHIDQAKPLINGIARPIPAEHNPPLDCVAKAADELLDALKKLDNSHPHANLSLWINDVWSDPLFVASAEIPGSFPLRVMSAGEMHDNARVGIVTALQRLKKSANEARYQRNNRPPEETQRVVERAFEFFVRNSPHKPTQSPTGAFAKFATKFHEAATGEYRGNLERAVRTVIVRNKENIERYWSKDR
jgi:hypothetical protein